MFILPQQQLLLAHPLLPIWRMPWFVLSGKDTLGLLFLLSFSQHDHPWTHWPVAFPSDFIRNIFFYSIKASSSKRSRTIGQYPRGGLSYHESHYQKQLNLWMAKCNIKDSVMVSGDSNWKGWARGKFLTRCTFSEPKFNIWYYFSYNQNKSPGTKGQHWVGLLLIVHLYLKFWTMLVQRL